MISIALIGGIGTGKSTVAAFLRDNYGAIWLNCDTIGHQLLNEPEIQEKLMEEFGVNILDENSELSNTINRQKLGKIVFTDQEELSKLNAIIHPPIMNELKNAQRKAEREGARICILDGALLMDVNVRTMVDEVWAITATQELRIERLMMGRQIPRQKAEQIMKNQISADEYAEYADRVISTNKGESDYAKTIREILSFLLKEN